MQTTFEALGIYLSELEAYLDEKLPEAGKILGLTPLRGDASDRAYFRVSFVPPGKETRSLVLMKISSAGPEGELPFVNIQRYLARLGLPVPGIYGYWARRGILLLEDLGDTTLEEQVKRASPSATADFYRRAVSLLARLQLSAARSPDPGCVAFQRQFDTGQFTGELLHFQRYMIEGVKGRYVSPRDKEDLQREFSSLCGSVASGEKVLCHRDYHSRNLMVRGRDLALLDFQDARLGPPSYDLASLLRDSYTVLPEDLGEEMIDTFCRLLEDGGLPSIPRKIFRAQFDLTALQRNLKALGTFAYQAMVRSNDRYLQHVPPTLDYIHRTLARYQSLVPFRRLLDRYLF